MTAPQKPQPRLLLLSVRILTYLILGGIVFSLTSVTELPFFVRTYLVFVSAGVGFLGLFWLSKRSKSD